MSERAPSILLFQNTRCILIFLTRMAKIASRHLVGLWIVRPAMGKAPRMNLSKWNSNRCQTSGRGLRPYLVGATVQTQVNLSNWN